MKLTRRVLAVIISAAMLLGMVAIGVSAAATSLTTYGSYDATTNPYQVKVGLKAFRVDDSGEYVEITDGKVLPGEEIRIEVWGQTNYHTMTANFVTAYSNALFAATKLDGSVYDYDATSASGLGAEVIAKVDYDEDAAAAAIENEGDFGASYDAPYEFNAVSVINTSFAGANSATALKSAYANTGVTADSYNVVSAGYGPDADLSLPAYENWGATRAAVITSYQPLFYYNLTVAGSVNDTGVVTIPAGAVRSSSNTAGKMYVSAAVLNALGLSNNELDGEEAVAEYLATYQTIASAECDHIMYKDTYADGTVADRVVDLSEGTINFTVVESLEGGDEPETVNKEALLTAINTLPAYTEDEADATTWATYEEKLAEANSVYADPDASQDDVNAAAEALLTAIAAVTAKPAVAPKLVAQGTTIIDEANGYIYGLTHGDFGGVSDIVGQGYVTVEGDGTVEAEYNVNAILGTGSTVTLKDSKGEVVETYTVIIFGDMDGDGFVTPDDLFDVSLWYAYMESQVIYDEPSASPYAFAMDVDGSGDVGDADMLTLDLFFAYMADDVPQNGLGV